jgi:hypothetical protein
MNAFRFKVKKLNDAAKQAYNQDSKRRIHQAANIGAIWFATTPQA